MQTFIQQYVLQTGATQEILFPFSWFVLKHLLHAFEPQRHHSVPPKLFNSLVATT